MSSPGSHAPRQQVRCKPARTVLAGGAASGLLAIASTGLGREHLPEMPDPEAAATGAPRDGTVDVRHGTRVPDPFRPLENSGRADVSAWIDAQDERARTYLAVAANPRASPQILRRCPELSRTLLPPRHGADISTTSTTGVDDPVQLRHQQGLGGARRRSHRSRDAVAGRNDVGIQTPFPDRIGHARRLSHVRGRQRPANLAHSRGRYRSRSSGHAELVQTHQRGLAPR